MTEHMTPEQELAHHLTRLRVERLRGMPRWELGPNTPSPRTELSIAELAAHLQIEDDLIKAARRRDLIASTQDPAVLAAFRASGIAKPTPSRRRRAS